MTESDSASLLGSVEVRAVHRDDVQALIVMIEALARYHQDEPTVTAERLSRDLLGDVPWAIGLVAAVPSSLLGYAILCRLYHAQSGKRGIDLHHLFVVEHARNAGVGTALLKGVTRFAREADCTFVRVGVNPENVAAQRFYDRHGFERRSPGGLRFSLKLRSAVTRAAS